MALHYNKTTALGIKPSAIILSSSPKFSLDTLRCDETYKQVYTHPALFTGV